MRLTKVGTLSTSTATASLTSPTPVGSATNTSTGGGAPAFTGAAHKEGGSIGSVLAFVGFCIMGLVVL